MMLQVRRNDQVSEPSHANGGVAYCFLRVSVTAAWRHGWQPAELVRHVGRELGGAYADLAADMVADEMRGYAPAMVEDRWAVQVPALGAGARAAGSDADERILGKIRALLAKAESTEFPDEAEALSARAQELMAGHGIDQALLAARSGSKDRPAARRLPVDGPYELPRATLLRAVAHANRCRSVWQKAVGMSAVVGFPSDLDAVELLYTLLLVQADTAVLREGARKDACGRSRTRAFRQSFLVAYGYRIGVRLSQAAVRAEREAAAAAPGEDLVPVLKERHEGVDHAVDEVFGDGLVYDRGSRAADEEGWAFGLAAAGMAALHSRERVGA
jgi:Protein of unknown function (DUF2786)